jgi:NTP pyrophosphatase (non-canonical NTP hydrolase)
MENFKDWIGRSVTRIDTLTQRLFDKYSATMSPFLFEAGERIAPPGLHFGLAPPTPDTDETGPDGAELKGVFLPPIPQPRRMWAGGSIETLRPLTIEETYELADAITDQNWKGIKEELGDLFLHLVFYARIGNEQQQFSLEEALNGVCDKLIYRHPHIYGDTQVKDGEEVKRNWEKLKMREGKKSVLGGVPVSLCDPCAGGQSRARPP